MAGDHEQNNTAARAEARLGIGRVALNRLRFNHESPTARMLDQSNVDRLVDVFKEVGCNNRDAEHSIPVVITRDQLHRVLQRSGLSEADLRSNDHEPPYLKLRKKEALSCLHGQHRHAAACHFFRHRPREDRWWTVTLYDRDALFTDARRDIAAGHSTSVWSFCGGEVYRHIQLATQRRDRRQRKQWKCRILTKQKRYDVRRLRHFPQYRELRDALDSLLPFRALWKGLRLGTLRRKFALRSPEVSTAVAPRLLETTN
ncbi:hypothetical protein ASPWEDRAFT_46905 [Aspergillus wentii DTO 134E9]|uniref:Uncharacterized protein n=1 Tax=Aspergillus wentii DTO 134E9 TaxID=1073089 RepID=A0A1L9R3U4_ASPWE|nr:uncharacterized protein ASPWEDRAFT_46905 [Aspergillus wentii DTO 134E9]OJJ29553.1 hypothetical protein ASPWEDRAFT_46905 [Aspergillus wentii DTO 134E9]